MFFYIIVNVQLFSLQEHLNFRKVKKHHELSSSQSRDNHHDAFYSNSIYIDIINSVYFSVGFIAGKRMTSRIVS